MGEYAIRKSDGAEIKIGTCEDMYYLRYEDREKVKHKPGNVDPVKDAKELRFRLPFPDEDHIQPGEYDDYNRGLRLYRASSVLGCSADFSDPETADDPGIIQLRHESGMLINVPCFHGEKLPDVSKPIQAFWNGRSWFYELYQLKETAEGVLPVVHCRFCNHAWRYTWDQVWDYIEPAMQQRLARYRESS